MTPLHRNRHLRRIRWTIVSCVATALRVRIRPSDDWSFALPWRNSSYGCSSGNEQSDREYAL